MPETVEGGVYRVGKKYVDANGKEVKKSEVSAAETKAEESREQKAEESSTESRAIPYAEALAKAGFETEDQIRSASDDDLLAVEGIGPARLAEIRAAVK